MTCQLKLADMESLIASRIRDESIPVPSEEAIYNLKFGECLPPPIAGEVFAARFNLPTNARRLLVTRLQSRGYNSPMKILFLHGWQSIPGGVKPTFLAQHGHTVINPKLPDDDFAAAVAIAQAEFDCHQPDVIVGSSRGGAVAMNLSKGSTPLVLLCPAWKKYGAAKTVKPIAIILHSRADDVVTFTDSEELVGTSGLPASALIEVGNDHRLADPEPLELMLRACERVKR